ncbi:MAG TPA: polysaccharide deacetylase family protein [Candidatus Saccharimonadales bacterium]|nr:polysaccharide deacetylase family protein [Candidatus Saccharimonadales bacterium]
MKRRLSRKTIEVEKILHRGKRKFRFLLAGIVIALILFSGVGFFVLHSVSKSVSHKALPKRALAVPISATPTLIASPSATPTASPSATPIAYSGFCLNVPVLFYHHIQPQAQAVQKGQTSLNVDNGVFDQQMGYLASHGYTTIFVDQLVNALKTHTGLGAKVVAVTFDDGYRDNYDNAFPVLKKYGIKFNLMLATGLTEGADFLTWGQVTEMKNSGQMFLTDHTWSHYAVNHGANDKIQFEIMTAKQQIESHTGQATNIFTYPYGSFNNNAVSLLQQDGFIGAFSTIGGFTQCDSFIMSLHRTRVGNASLSSYGL